MKKNLLTFILLTFCLLSIHAQKVYSNQVIVKLKKEYNTNGKGIDDAQKVLNVGKQYSAVKTEKVLLNPQENLFVYTIEFPEGTNFSQVIKEYEKTGEVEYAEPNYEIQAPEESVTLVPDNLLYAPKQQNSSSKVLAVTNDPYYYKQWGLNNTGTFITPSVAGADIDIERAWDIQKGSSNIIVAVLDTGIKMDHPELAGRMWVNSGEIPGNGIDDDHNGFIDDVYGWNFAEGNNTLTDVSGHGTNIAGIIGADTNNGTGFAGVDWNCKIMNVRIYTSSGGGANTISVASAIDYAVNNGARIINFSSTASQNSSTIITSISNALSKNVIMIASMGNENNSDGVYYYFPAAYAGCNNFSTLCDGVIAVGATDATDNRMVISPTFGSNHRNYTSIAAPGQNIYGLSNYTSGTDSYNVSWNGTSQAAPYVSGLAALLLAQDPTRTPAQIKDIIQSTAEKVGSDAYNVNGWNEYLGYGRINAYQALAKYLSTEDPLSQTDVIKVYPNPAPHEFHCNYPLGTKQIDIFSPIGQLVVSRNVEGSDSQIFNISESGIYFVQFTLKDNKKINKKVIITK